MSHSRSWAPWRAKPSAIALPIPEPAPVTAATFPFRVMDIATLLRRQPAVYHEGVPGHERGIVGDQEERRARHLIWRSLPPDGHGPVDGFGQRLRAAHRLDNRVVEGGVDPARAEAVDPDVSARVVECHGLGEEDDDALRRGGGCGPGLGHQP